jgi:hypothetical protein
VGIDQQQRTRPFRRVLYVESLIGPDSVDIPNDGSFGSSHRRGAGNVQRCDPDDDRRQEQVLPQP